MKPWYKSSTLWMNLGVGTLYYLVEQLRALVPPEYAPLVVIVLNVLNRFRTTTALTLR